jgi:hypothetical protein
VLVVFKYAPFLEIKRHSVEQHRASKEEAKPANTILSSSSQEGEVTGQGATDQDICTEQVSQSANSRIIILISKLVQRESD